MTPDSPLPPQLPGLPAIGSGLAFYRDAVGMVRRARRDLGPVFGLRLGPKRAVMVVGAAESQEAFRLPESVLSVRPVYQWVIPMFGNVLQAAEYGEYCRQRETVLPAFRARQLGGYSTVMVDETTRWLAGLDAKGTFDAAGDLERLSMAIALRVFLGPRLRDYGEEVFALFRDIAAGMEFFLPANLPIPRLRRRNRARKALLALLQPELARARRDPDPEEYGFLAHLVSGPHGGPAGLPLETLAGLILCLAYAAYETTAAQASWALILLLQHPKELAAVLDEVDRQLPANGDGLGLGDLHKLERTRLSLLEAQRCRPITTLLMRYTEQAYRIGGHVVPAGWYTMFCPPVTHESPDVYPDPGRYDPDRFGPERDQDGRAAGSLVNMGDGHHLCVGAKFAEVEMKIVLGLLLQRYELRLRDPDPPPAKGLGIYHPAAPCLVDYRSR